SNGYQVGDIISGLCEATIANLEIQVVARVEEANTFRPSRETLVALVKSRGDLLDELAVLWVVRSVFMACQNLAQSPTVLSHAGSPLWDNDHAHLPGPRR